jgi:hypothetical protein
MALTNSSLVTVDKTPVFNPGPPLPGARVRPAGPGIAVAARPSFQLFVVQPVLVGTRDRRMVSLSIWWTRPDGLHAPDSRRSCLLHMAELPAVIEALKKLLEQEARHPAPSGNGVQPRIQRTTHQDEALLLLAAGYGPRDLPSHLWPSEDSEPRRLTELGKALRRAGYLVPRNWTLTLEGEVRVAALKRSRGEGEGEDLAETPNPLPF